MDQEQIMILIMYGVLVLLFVLRTIWEVVKYIRAPHKQRSSAHHARYSTGADPCRHYHYRNEFNPFRSMMTETCQYASPE